MEPLSTVVSTNDLLDCNTNCVCILFKVFFLTKKKRKKKRKTRNYIREPAKKKKNHPCGGIVSPGHISRILFILFYFFFHLHIFKCRKKKKKKKSLNNLPWNKKPTNLLSLII